MVQQDTAQPPTRGSRQLLLAALVIMALAAAIFAWTRWGQQPVAAPPLKGNAPNPSIAAEALPIIPFADIAKTAGIEFVHHGGATGEKMLPESGGSGCAFFDYDNDGDPYLRLIIGRGWPWDEKTKQSSSALALYRNDGGGKFTDVTTDAGLAVDFYGQGVAVGDYDADGDDDLFVTAVGPN